MSFRNAKESLDRYHEENQRALRDYKSALTMERDYYDSLCKDIPARVGIYIVTLGQGTREGGNRVGAFSTQSKALERIWKIAVKYKSLNLTRHDFEIREGDKDVELFCKEDDHYGDICTYYTTHADWGKDWYPVKFVIDQEIDLDHLVPF